MKRTQEEILAMMGGVEEWDFLGIMQNDLVEFLTYDNAKPFLKEGTTPEQWDEVRADVKSPREQMIDYMPFAWEKANGFRGLSAARSMMHYYIWLWLDGDETLHKTLITPNGEGGYTAYGKPQLVAICNYLGLDSSVWDDGIRADSEEEYERMMDQTQ